MPRVIGSGPSTHETKDWLSETKKAVVLTIIIWLVLCSIWMAVSFFCWLIDPHSQIVLWFKDRPRLWLSVNVAMLIPCLLGLLIWAWQELLDADFTSLQGKHGLSGIMPMTPLVRAILFVRWLRGDEQKTESQSRISKMYDFLFGDDTEEAGSE